MAKLLRLPVHVRVVPGHAAALPLRPADGPRLEGAHPAGARLVAAASRASTSPATRAGTPARRRRPLAVLVGIGVGAAADRRHRARRAPPRARPSSKGAAADGLPRGLPRHVRQALQGHRVGRARSPYPYVEGQRPEAREARAPPRPPRPQPVRGRHGEVHRLRAVRRRVPGPLHLRARRRQPARRPGVARRALRLRLRDQLPAVHPLRPVRRGVPHRGHHRVEAVRVLLHQPPGRDLHEGRAGRRTTTACPSSCRGRTGATSTRWPPHLGVDARHRARRATPSTRASWRGRASSATA